jgi:ubiquinone/menaquinone biosynthesis C-methylase UbiE
MNEFDIKAIDWDNNQMHIERADAVAKEIGKAVALTQDMKGFEYGCGTGLLSFRLIGSLKEITLADSSAGMLDAEA